MRYAYTAKSAQGETTAGTLTADSPAQVQRQLRDQGLFVISLKTAVGGKRGARRAGRTRGRVAKKDLMTLTSQLAIMTRAGIDVAGALGSLARQCASPALQQALEAVHQEVMSGQTVSAALKSRADVFGPAYVASVAAGEASGQLPEVLSRLARLQRGELRLRNTIRSLMAYPLVLASVSTLVIAGLVLLVLPQFSGVFAQFDMPLPAITQVLLDVSDQLRSRWWLWLGLVVLAAGGLWTMRSTEKGRRTWHHFVLHAALVREVSRTLLIGRTLRLLGIMIESGVPLLDGLRMTRASLSNSLYRELFEHLEHEVLNGRGLASALAGAEFIPPGVTEMIATGERTGTLGMVTQVLGEFYEEEGESRLKELATLLEPVIIVVMGVVVAFIVLAVMLPIFEFATLGQ